MTNCSQMARPVTQFIGKLMERSQSSHLGLDDFEVINQCIVRFISETFTTYDK